MSPNLIISDSIVDLSAYQPVSEKGDPSGYASLNASGVVPPAELFPNFSASPVGSLYVKGSSTAMAVQAGTTFDANGIIAGQVRVGLITGTQYGIDQQRASAPLYLHSSSGSNRVYISYLQSIGGADSGGNNFTWSVGPTGTFALSGGTFGGTVNMTTHAISNITTASGSALTVNFATGGIASTGTMALTGTVTVPNASSGSVDGRPVNRVSGDALYARKDTTNTYSQVQTFTQKPTFTALLNQSDTTGLTAALADRLTRSTGGAMSGAIAMGSNKITGLGAPTAATQDATTAIYVESLSTTSTGGILTNLIATAPLTKSMSSNVTTISMPVASNSSAGYLSINDWQKFNAGSAAMTNQDPAVVFAGPVEGEDEFPTFRALQLSDLAAFVIPEVVTRTIGLVLPYQHTDSAVIDCCYTTIGSPVTLGFGSSGPVTGIIYTAYVSGVDQVKIRATNITASNITLGAASYTVMVTRI